LSEVLPAELELTPAQTFVDTKIDDGANCSDRPSFAYANNTMTGRITNYVLPLGRFPITGIPLVSGFVDCGNVTATGDMTVGFTSDVAGSGTAAVSGAVSCTGTLTAPIIGTVNFTASAPSCLVAADIAAAKLPNNTIGCP